MGRLTSQKIKSELGDTTMKDFIVCKKCLIRSLSRTNNVSFLDPACEVRTCFLEACIKTYETCRFSGDFFSPDYSQGSQ